MAHTRKRNGNLTETDLAQDRMGSNRLQGNDQANVRNQRQSVPDAKQDADAVKESFRKLDKHERARKDLNKGAMRGSK
jgi:hypothetical protein